MGNRQFGVLRLYSFAALLFALTGCVAPDPVDPASFATAESLPNGVERYETRGAKPVRRNLLFVFGDVLFRESLDPRIQDFYHRPDADLESLVWWQHAPLLRQVYSVIYRIPQAKLGHRALIDTILALEARGESYDVVLLTHGYPNHLTIGRNYYFSKDEFTLLPPLRHLHLVYMQACWGSSLMRAWRDAGAEYVIGFTGAHENLFWFSLMLRRYRFEDLEEAFAENNRNYRWKIRNDLLLSRAIPMLGFDLDEYLDGVEDPELLRRDAQPARLTP